MNLLDDIINLKAEEINNIKKEYSLKFVKNDKGYNFLVSYLQSFDDDKIKKYDYYGINDNNINHIIKDLKEDIFLESDDKLTLGSVILNKMFKSLNMIFVDSTKTNIKFINDLAFEDEENIYNKDGIKLGHLLNLLIKNEEGIDKYYQSLWAHFDFVFFKINDYRGIVFQNPYYRIKGAFKSPLDLKNKTKANVSLLDIHNLNDFSLSDESIDYYVEDLNEKQIQYLNNLGNHQEILDKKYEKYIKMNKKFIKDSL